jgi:hypothetical protein
VVLSHEEDPSARVKKEGTGSDERELNGVEEGKEATGDDILCG